MPGSQLANFLAATSGDDLIYASVEDTLARRAWIGTCDFLFESKMTAIGRHFSLGWLDRLEFEQGAFA